MWLRTFLWTEIKKKIKIKKLNIINYIVYNKPQHNKHGEPLVQMFI